jgi:hypothetical protein
MADFAPYSVNRPPFPNVHVNMPARIEQYLLTLTGTNGAVAVNTALTSGGCSATRTGEGTYTLTFPAGGTGAIGWLQVCPVIGTAGDVTIPRVISIDSDVASTSFALGAVAIVSADLAATPAVNDILGDVTILINVIKAVV